MAGLMAGAIAVFESRLAKDEAHRIFEPHLKLPELIELKRDRNPIEWSIEPNFRIGSITGIKDKTVHVHFAPMIRRN